MGPVYANSGEINQVILYFFTLNLLLYTHIHIRKMLAITRNLLMVIDNFSFDFT